MEHLIEQTLAQIEKEHHIHILYATESGSRAWGFASPDSDYDVRYIYVRPREDYLRLDQYRDTIEGPLDEVLDFSGWDIRKALLLLQKTNPSLMEWVRSPIVYRTTPVWQALVKEFPQFFSVKKNMLHYLSMASTDWDKMLVAQQVKLKRYLYTLRTLLCCRWLDRYGDSPPIEFDILCRQMLPQELSAAVAELLRRKVSADETGLTDHFPALDAFITSEITRLRERVNAMPADGVKDIQILNDMFLKVLEQTEPRP